MQKMKFYFFILINLLYLATDIKAGSRRRYKKKQLAQNSQMVDSVHERITKPIYKPTLAKVIDATLDRDTAVENVDPRILSIKSSSNRMIENLTNNADNFPESPTNLIAPGQTDIPQDLENVKSKSNKSNILTPSLETNVLSSNDLQSSDELIELQFEDADLQNFIKQIEEIFEVTFITDDAIEPLVKGAKAIKGNKISFKTQVPLSRTEAWNLFVTFLQIAGFAVVETIHDRTYRIAPTEAARKLPLPAFIGTDYTLLPDSDELIRFVYFVENSPLDAIKTMVDALRSSASSLIILQEQKAFVLTDRAYNIKMLMEIVKGLDKVAMPQSVSVMKLRRADAKQVKELYDSIIQGEDKTVPNKIFTRRQPTSIFFPENMRIIAEPRTNALILLGPKDAIEKVEEFIKKHIDIELDQPYSPLYVHQLRYADAGTIADIMNNVTQFGKETEAGKSGGVRGIDKYMQPMSFVPERETNRLVIKGYYNDYLKAKEIIEKLDEPQPQVAIEILLLSVNLNNTKSLGAQIRSKDKPTGLLGENIKFQTSGLFNTTGIIENTATTTGVQRLLGNLLQAVKGASPGNTIISLGTDLLGVWGVLQILQTITNTQVISNPFLIATNKTPAVVSLGEERRVQTALVVGTSDVESFGKDDANLKVEITPQINSDGMIVLDLRIIFDNFINPPTALGEQSATKNVREIKTSTIVSNKEVLALGGLIRNRILDNMSKVPILGDIPILGWLFKNKEKEQIKENLLILISTRIVEAGGEGALGFTQNRLGDFNGTLDSMYQISDRHDPIHKVFFDASYADTENIAQNLLFERHNTNVINKRKRTRSTGRSTPKDLEARHNINIVPTATPVATPVVQIEAPAAATIAIDQKPHPIKPTIAKIPPQSTPTPTTKVSYKPRLALPNETIANKKRTSLSLSNFLSNDKTKERT